MQKAQNVFTVCVKPLLTSKSKGQTVEDHFFGHIFNYYRV